MGANTAAEAAMPVSPPSTPKQPVTTAEVKPGAAVPEAENVQFFRVRRRRPVFVRRRAFVRRRRVFIRRRRRF